METSKCIIPISAGIRKKSNCVGRTHGKLDAYKLPTVEKPFYSKFSNAFSQSNSSTLLVL